MLQEVGTRQTLCGGEYLLEFQPLGQPFSNRQLMHLAPVLFIPRARAPRRIFVDEDFFCELLLDCLGI